MKTVHTLSLRRTTSDICSPSPSQRKDSAHLLFYVIGSLFLFASRSHVHLPDWTRLFRETLPGAAKRLEHTIHYKTAKSRHCIITHTPFRRKTFHARISRTQTNQQDSFESARSSQISEILPNRQDPSVSARLLKSDGYSPTAFHHRAIALHSLPQLEGLSLVVFSIFKRLSGLLRVRGLLIVRAQSPFLVIAV